MNLYIAITDQTRFNNLRYMQDLDEVSIGELKFLTSIPLLGIIVYALLPTFNDSRDNSKLYYKLNLGSEIKN
jgi:hypothetical protein